MIQLTYGTKGQIAFGSENDFYESLGFLAKNDGTTTIHWEHNEVQGAWGSEGRIHCYKNLPTFPAYFSSAFTAGRGRVLHRINCNEYVEYIATNHSFIRGQRVQNEPAIRATIPPAYIPDYLRGLAL